MLISFPTVGANNLTDKACYRIFAESFEVIDVEEIHNDFPSHGGDYVHNQCFLNIDRLLHRFEKLDGFKRKDASVLYIYTDAGAFEYILENNVNIRQTSLFRTHFILEYQGYIYDLDYTSTARPTAVKTYFESLFSPQKQQKIKIAKIPADVYNGHYPLMQLRNAKIFNLDTLFKLGLLDIAEWTGTVDRWTCFPSAQARRQSFWTHRQDSEQGFLSFGQAWTEHTCSQSTDPSVKNMTNVVHSQYLILG